MQAFDKSLCELADSDVKVHQRIAKRAKETEELKGQQRQPNLYISSGVQRNKPF